MVGREEEIGEERRDAKKGGEPPFKAVDTILITYDTTVAVLIATGVAPNTAAIVLPAPTTV